MCYLKETIILAGKAYLVDYFMAPRTVETVEIDERDRVIGGLDLVETWMIMYRPDIVGGNTSHTRGKIG